MKIAMLQLNPLVGDCRGNVNAIIRAYKQACQHGASLVVAAELAIVGYPPKDLLLRDSFLDLHDQALAHLMREVGEVGLIIGTIERNKDAGKPLYNASLLIQNGKVQQRQYKTLLPNYDVFDERRYFEPNNKAAQVFMYRGYRMMMLICEDIWGGSEYALDPIVWLEQKSVDVLITINASPYYPGKGAERARIVSNIAQKLYTSVVYVNQVGGNDELVFDGRSFAVNSRGDCIGLMEAFRTEVGSVSLGERKTISFPKEGIGDLYEALVLGVRDYLHKSKRSDVVIGLSGGIDSALTAVIATDALGREHVRGYTMPSDFSSQGSIDDAVELARSLGIDISTVNIAPLYDAYKEALSPNIGWNVPGMSARDATEENIQARIRGNILMADSNRRGAIVLATGNKSELSVGYCTLYGDMVGGFSVLADISKTNVYKLARYINREREIIPKSTIEKPPSAELRPGQVDQDSLPPYEMLDAVLEAYIEGGNGAQAIADTFGYPLREVRWIINKVNGNEYKRWQMPPGLKVSHVAFGTGWRFPIVALAPS